jgi:hypothetical protein
LTKFENLIIYELPNVQKTKIFKMKIPKELNFVKTSKLFFFKKILIKEVLKNFNGEFDPGSGRTLAVCLTHASRTRSFFFFAFA